MGCASSKQAKCRHCETPYSPMSRRSFSMNVHHPPEKKGDTYHVVALTSSTLGSIKLDSPKKSSMWDDFEEDEVDVNMKNDHHHEVGGDKEKDFTMGMIEAKAWSKMIDEKITRVAPRTPIRTPPGEPETINVMELMEGLDDSSPLRLGEHVRSFSFHVSADSIPPLIDSPRAGGGGGVCHETGFVSPKKTIWGDAQEKGENGVGNGNLISKSLLSQFDPEVISAFRKALEELSPTNPFYMKPREGGVVTEEKLSGISSDEVTKEKKINGFALEEAKINGIVDNGFAHVNGFVDRIITEEEKENLVPAENGHLHAHTNGNAEEEEIEEEFEESYGQTSDYEEEEEFEEEMDEDDVYYEKERVVLYFTSLRGVRKTYEDCGYVRLILKGLGVRVDEKDVSMHSGFREELKELLGEEYKAGLPKVFIGENYIGGVEEIRRLHEDGKLEILVQGCEMLDDDSGNLIDVCEACGDIRFLPCETCSGSCKIYDEEDESGFQRCPDCNENGLVRCPMCCY